MLAVPSPQPCPPPLFSSSVSATTSASAASSKFLIVILIIAFAFLTSVSFNLLRHLISRRRSSAPPPSFCRSPFSHTEHPTSATSTPPPPSDRSHLASSFPSPISVLHKSLDCAVCLSPFRPSDDLRLLPSCRHAFHLQCIDLWLQSTPSCPLCRSPAAPAEEPGASSSFQVEIDLTYPLDCSVEHLVDDQVEAPVEAKEENGGDGEEAAGMQAEITEEDDGGGQGWLREYLDRMASSASTSFNSLAFSGRLSSHRFDSGSLESVAACDGRSWDIEGVEWVEESGLAGIYRWFVGI